MKEFQGFIENKNIENNEEKQEEQNESHALELGENAETENNVEWNTGEAVGREKSILESLRDKSKSLYLAMTFLTAFSFIKATVAQAEGSAGIGDVTMIEQVKEENSENDSFEQLESSKNIFLQSIPDNLESVNVISLYHIEGEGPSVLENSSAADYENAVLHSDEDIYVGVHDLSLRSGNDLIQDGALAIGYNKGNIEAIGESFEMNGFGESEEEAIIDALKSAAYYMGVSVSSDWEKSSDWVGSANEIVSPNIVESHQSEFTSGHYIDSYKVKEVKKLERFEGDKAMTVILDVQPGAIGAAE